MATAAAILIVAAASPAANTPGGPTLSVKTSVSPNHLVPGLTNKHGMPITLKFHLGITHPADSRYRLDKVVVRFPSGVGAPHGELFPSCSVAQLEKAHNRLSACPRGSKIGRGVAVGTAIDLPVTSSGKLTLFNGPRGKSITFNVNITTPALINKTFSAPLKKTGGRYGYVLTSPVPTELQNIIDGPIVVRSIDVTTGATIVKNGVRRGYVEAYKCPKSHKAPLHVDASFNSDTGLTATASADTDIACH
ncbi:MAG TPA: hypothetical protein VFG31_00430 [Conexibacter sp.]|nr:hypothetical protein [Conexibacter sp.]